MYAPGPAERHVPFGCGIAAETAKHGKTSTPITSGLPLAEGESNMQVDAGESAGQTLNCFALPTTENKQTTSSIDKSICGNDFSIWASLKAGRLGGMRGLLRAPPKQRSSCSGTETDYWKIFETAETAKY